MIAPVPSNYSSYGLACLDADLLAQLLPQLMFILSMEHHHPVAPLQGYTIDILQKTLPCPQNNSWNPLPLSSYKHWNN